MKLVRSKAFSGIIFIAFCLLFSYQFLIFAQQLETKFPAELQELLQGKSSDVSLAASQLKETDLPAALAVIELLKFKALHREIPASVDQISDFEAIIKSRLKNSSVVSFSKTETCRKKVEATEIEVAGQKIAIPEYYIAEIGLAITGVIPTGETGTVFPDLQINIYSQAALAKYSLLIDGKAVPNNKISLFKDSDELGLIFRPDLNADSILSIGTHTAEISITNADGEKAEKQWSFTVGVYDVPTLPLPEGTKIIKELPIESEKILPGQKINGRLSVVIYQDKVGKKYTLYKLRTSSGQIITSQNLAFIGRKLIVDRDDPDEVTISPKTHLAFVGNKFNFSYTYVGSGKVLSDRWYIRNGGTESTESSVTMAGDIDVSCILMIEKSGVDTDGNPVPYQYEISETRHIGRVSVTERIFHDRRMLISNEPSSSIPVEGEVWLWLDNTVHEGKKYTLETGELTVDKLRWKVQAAEGSPTIKNPVATMTQILFSEHGFAELVFDIKMTYRESGESYESNFKPEVSGLYAFYPVEGKAVFKQFPRGQISIGRRHLKLKSFEFTIKKQKRFISSPSDFELSEPVLICESSIWPASSPIKITKALPVISKGHSNKFLGTVDPFTFITPMALDEDEIPLSLFGRFFFDQEASLVNPTLISNLESIPVFEAEDLIELQLSPSELITIQEGLQTEFEAQLAPVYDYGTGLYSATDKSLNILDGYTISSVENIFWFEEPLWGDDEEEDWKKKAAKTLDFLHVFDPFMGVGSYSMNCGFVMNIQESDTKDEVSAFIVNSTPVNVLPGLRILSPIDKLAYPLNQTINVKTTLDSEEYLDQWQSIKWKLNGKEFNPEVEKPPFKITLDHVGKWQLEAELKIKDPDTDKEIILKDSAEFEVKPLEISISPRRKVFDFSKQQDADINISVLVNGDEIEKPGEPVPWQDEDLQLVVDSVAWKLVTAPENCADCNFDDQSFKADCQFASTGAATTLATLTVRILGAEKLFNKKHKGFDDKFEEQIFEIPAGRADLWAVYPPAWQDTVGKSARRAIQNTARLFSIDSGNIEFDGKLFGWSKDSNFGDSIKLSAAATGIRPLTSVDVKFAWSGPDEQSSETPEFKPDFKNSGSQEVIMGSAIEFDSGDNIKFEKDKTDVKVEPLSKVVYVKVLANPSTVGKSQISKVSLSFGEINGAMDSQTQLDIWDGEYNLKLTKVDWSYSGASLSTTDENGANAQFSSSDIGQYKISGTPKFSIKPLYCDLVDMTLNPAATVIRVLGSLSGIKVNKSLPDHLKKIRYAKEPGVDIYTKSNNYIWTPDEVQPLIVACNSTITLIPEFKGQKKHKIRDGVTFQWFDSDGLLALSGNTDLDDEIYFPTPTVIDKYTLKLGFAIVGETIAIPETYTVKKITEKSSNATGTANLVYYMKCIKDSVSALKGKRSSTPDKEMVDTFYDWWWSDANKLSYNKPAWHADTVILSGGGMCGGLADYFAICLQCQGVAGVERFTMLLNDTIVPFQAPAKTLKSPFPKSQEYWGAVVYTDHGLHCKIADMPGPLPQPPVMGNGEHAYTYSKLRFYTDREYPLPYEVASNTIIIYGGPNNQIDENIECPNVYVFLAPKDGHVIVRYKTEKKSFLYDPTFGEGKYKYELDDFPTVSDGKPTNVVIKHYREKKARKPALWQYFKNSIGWVRGFIPYFAKYSDMPHGQTVFDVPPECINFLHLNIQTDKDLFPK